MFSAIVPSKRKLSCSTTPRCCAVVAQLDRGEVVAVDEDAAAQRPVEGHHQADQRALARSARADERGRRSGRRAEGHVLQHRRAGVVLEGDVVELDLAADVGQRRAVGVLLIFGRHAADLADAIEPGERLAHLRADRRQLDHRHRHQRGEREVHHQIADRHRAAADRVAADQHHRDAGRADHDRRERGDRRDAGQRLRDVAEQAVRALARRRALRAFRRCRP